MKGMYLTLRRERSGIWEECMTRNSEDSERVQDEGRTLKFGDVEVLDEIRDGEGKYRRFTWSEGVEDV